MRLCFYFNWISLIALFLCLYNSVYWLRVLCTRGWHLGFFCSLVCNNNFTFTNVHSKHCYLRSLLKGIWFAQVGVSTLLQVSIALSFLYLLIGFSKHSNRNYEFSRSSSRKCFFLHKYLLANQRIWGYCEKRKRRFWSLLIVDNRKKPRKVTSYSENFKVYIWVWINIQIRFLYFCGIFAFTSFFNF